MSKKILIIDDYTPLLDEVSEYLSLEGYKIITAHNGAEGIQKALIHKPEMILCDILMPELDGYEVFKAISTIPALSATPFIFLTAKATPDDYKKGLSLGVDDYLTKPFTADALISSINKRFEKIEKYKSTKKDLIDFLFNNPLISIMIYNDNKFIFLNEKVIDFLGYELKEIKNIDIKKLIINDDFDIEKEFALVASGVKKEISRIIAIKSKNNQVNNVELFGKLIIIDNKESLILAFTVNNESKLNKINENLEKIQNFFDTYNNKDISDEITNLLKNEIKQVAKPLKIKLSERETEVLELICQGLTNKDIADKLSISFRTVDNHRAALLEKTNTKNTAELVAFSIKNKIINLDKI